MSILQWNICGYGAKYPNLKKLVKDESPACVCLQETMLGSRHPKPPSGYTLLTDMDAATSPGHGLGILVHTSIPFIQINVMTPLNTLIARIQIDDQMVTVCNLYISPSQRLTIEQINNLITQLPTPFLILGDINAKHNLWGDQQIYPRGRIFENTILNNNITIMNTGSSTHFHCQTGTFHSVDISLCSPVLLPLFVWRTLDDLHGSDHFPILINSDHSLPSRPVRYNIKRAKWPDFKEETKVNDIRSNCTTQRYNNFINHIHTAADKFIPKTKSSNIQKPVPWWTSECNIVCNERKQALRRYQRSRLLADKIVYKRARAKAQYILKQSMKVSWQNYISTINIYTPMSKIWNKIRKLSGKYTINHPPSLMVNGQLISKQRDVSEIMGNHFSAVSSCNNYSATFNQHRQLAEQNKLNFQPISLEDYNAPITIDEIAAALKTCNESAPGEDLITYSMLKHLHPTALLELANIANGFFMTGQFPEAWSRATVLSFLKPGKDRTLQTSYRPIALTSCVCKLVEKVINVRLVRTLEKKELISNNQFGFRKHRSTSDCLIQLQTAILDALSKKEHCVVTFFDLEKAYDTTWRYGILKSLHEAGIRGPLFWFIENFLKNRTFRTKIGDALSGEFQQEQGVPQGSVLSFTLALIAINGILSELPPHVSVLLFVDDL